MKYASHARVSEEKSRAEIERVVRNYAGRGAEFTCELSSGRADVPFINSDVLVTAPERCAP